MNKSLPLNKIIPFTRKIIFCWYKNVWRYYVNDSRLKLFKLEITDNQVQIHVFFFFFFCILFKHVGVLYFCIYSNCYLFCRMHILIQYILEIALHFTLFN
jgi:FlaA1/EpsC-like NDP-sugar epimerase